MSSGFNCDKLLSSIGFNCVESCSIDSDELMDHQNSRDIWKE